VRYAPAPDALVAHLHGEAVVLHAGSRAYFRMNETAQHVWRLLEQGVPLEAILDSVLAAFDVDPDTARADVLSLLQELQAAELVVAVEDAP
jgi:hypothetical protein